MSEGFTDSEKFAKDLSFMTEADWERRKEIDRERWARREAEKKALREEMDDNG